VGRPGWHGESLTPYVFLTPTLLALAVVFFYPMLVAIWMSLHSGGLGMQIGRFAGLAEYRRVLASPYFWNSLQVSVILALGNLVGTWILGLGTALMLQRSFPGRGIARALVIIPWAIPYVAAALIWGWMFDYTFGVLNYIFRTLHLISKNTGWLTGCPAALWSLTGVSVWKLFPLGTVMFLAGLQTIPAELYEAARVDGAGRLMSFRHVTLPGIRAVGIVLTLLITIWAFGRAFTIIYILTEGGPAGCTETLVIRTYLEAFKFFHPGTGAALGTIVLLISLAFALVYLRAAYRPERR